MGRGWFSAVSFVFASAALAAPTGLPGPVTDADYTPVNAAEAQLGQLLFWDKELSGNRNISCGTCHHPKFGTSDGQSLGMGEGGVGLGPDRVSDPKNLPEQRIPRNSPGLWNLGAKEFTVMFHDGRIEVDPGRPSGLRTPIEDNMVMGFSGVLSAQNMFPVLSNDEMAGHYEENDISTAVRQGRITGVGGAWEIIAARIAAIPEYDADFKALNPEIAAGRPLHFTDITNALAAFAAFEFRSDGAPFDAWLRGEASLPPAAMAGMALFYGDAGCSACHSGKFQTDQGFHAMGTPQLGPGKSERFERHQRDIGRMRVTNQPQDRYAFRTPSLRNVTLTAPYGHAGGHLELADFLRFHADPKAGLASYSAEAVLSPFEPAKADWAVLEAGEEFPAIAATVTQAPVALSDARIGALVAFLTTLEDPGARAGRLGIPKTVPSGLPVDR